MKDFTSSTWTPDRTAYLTAAWVNGTSLANISHHLGVSPSSISSKVCALNLTHRRKTRVVKYQGQDIPLAKLVTKVKSPHTYEVVWARIQRGWDLERALHSPPQRLPIVWTPELTNQLRELAKTHLSARLIGKEMGISSITVYKKLARLKVKRIVPVKRGNIPYNWTEEKINLLKECLKNQLSITEIGRQLGFWRGAVRLKIIELGLNDKSLSGNRIVRSRHSDSIWTLAYDERLIYLWNSGVKAGKIAAEFGVSKPTIFGRAQTLKLSPRHTIPKKKT